MKYHHKKMIGQVWLVIISRLLPFVCSDDLNEPLPPAHFIATHMHDNFTEDDFGVDQVQPTRNLSFH